MNDKTGIYVSINPASTYKIVQGIKKYEFRNYVPKRNFKFLYVYVTAPKSELRYIVEIGNVVQYPTKLRGESDGVSEFNKGSKAKYAYPVLDVYELLKPISLEELKKEYAFVAPQAFAYDTAYPFLTEYIKSADKQLIVSG